MTRAEYIEKESGAENKIYLCIDLKSFYASVECVERGLDPFTTNLVVADETRGNGGICLAVSPQMKSRGVRNRCRLFEIPQGMSYICAKPRMRLYMKYSADIYSIYMKYVSYEDIHIYSIDECFIDITPYLSLYGLTARELTKRMIQDVMETTGICATAGIGTNMFLAKVALDITAKHSPDHIGWLDLAEFRRTIWEHEPITDIWNIGRGTARRLAGMGAVNLRQVSELPDNVLMKVFGVNARFLIDHANGYEPCTIRDIKNYQSKSHSLSNSQILFSDYEYNDALVILKEMVEQLALELVEKRLVAGAVSLFVGYSDDMAETTGGSRKLDNSTSSQSVLSLAFEELYYLTTDPLLPIRQIGISFGNVTEEGQEELTLFSDRRTDERERAKQRAVLEIKQRFGKNSIISAKSLQACATAMQRNGLVGGHNAG